MARAGLITTLGVSGTSALLSLVTIPAAPAFSPPALEFLRRGPDRLCPGLGCRFPCGPIAGRLWPGAGVPTGVAGPSSPLPTPPPLISAHLTLAVLIPLHVAPRNFQNFTDLWTQPLSLSQFGVALLGAPAVARALSVQPFAVLLTKPFRARGWWTLAYAFGSLSLVVAGAGVAAARTPRCGEPSPRGYPRSLDRRRDRRNAHPRRGGPGSTPLHAVLLRLKSQRRVRSQVNFSAKDFHVFRWD